MTLFANISIVAGTILTLLAIIKVMWSISSSVTKTQVSVGNIETHIITINANMVNFDERIKAVERIAYRNEDHLKTTFIRLDELRIQNDEKIIALREDLRDAIRHNDEKTLTMREDLKESIKEIKENCRVIQSLKRKGD